MSTTELGRRDFLRYAAVVTGAGITGFGVSSLAGTLTTTQAWTLNTSWGFPKGARGRTSCGCQACVTHAANKVFASREALEAGLAHPGCLCEPATFDLRTTIYDALFTTPGLVEVDRRDPEVADLLGAGMDTVIESFAPERGRAGAMVTLTGRQFSGAMAVRFNGAATSFSVDTHRRIEAVVPSGATAGVIMVEMPDGSVRSSGAFAVRHPRAVTMRLAPDATTGRIWTLDGYTPGRQGALVLIQRLENEGWTDVGGVRTDANGAFRLRPMTVPGRYRAHARWRRLPSEDLCMPAISRETTIP